MPIPSYNYVLTNLALHLSYVSFIDYRIENRPNIAWLGIAEMLYWIRLLLDMLSHYLVGVGRRLLMETELVAGRDSGELADSKQATPSFEQMLDFSTIIGVMGHVVRSFGIHSVLEGTIIKHFLACLLEGTAYYGEIRRLYNLLEHLFSDNRH